MGISHLYSSPVLAARPGSQHGCDVIDHGRLNPELGTRKDFDGLVAALHAHGMGLVVDIMPNHMGVLGGDNAWWLEVLENGTASAWADCSTSPGKPPTPPRRAVCCCPSWASSAAWRSSVASSPWPSTRRAVTSR